MLFLLNTLPKMKDVIKKEDLQISNETFSSHKEENKELYSELVVANNELVFQYQQKEKFIDELTISNKKLALQIVEKDKCHAELLLVHNKLSAEHHKNKKHSKDLVIANLELLNIKEHQKEYINGLEEIMFMTSHKVRHPIANILGLSYLLDHEENSAVELKEYLDHIKQSALTLDDLTKELTIFISTLGQKGKYI